ncbi:hypothetical protein SLA2020_407880 [Shorea laevis]
MESLDPAASCFVDDLLNFGSDVGEEDDDEDRKPCKPLLSVNPSRPSHEHVGEEELEWISNKDAFPAVESIYVLGNGITKQTSPVSVLENSNSSSSTNGSTLTNGNIGMCCWDRPRVPVKARSKSRRKLRNDLQTKGGWWVHENAKNVAASGRTMGRKCQHCGAEKTPQWRAGPLGPKTLCNACGVRYKSGRLCDEYRPASSPTFSSELHSNSHRKIMEIRRQKQQSTMLVVKPVDKG